MTDVLRLEELRFSNSFTRLPTTFYHRLAPTPLSNPRLIDVNPAAMSLLKLDDGQSDRVEFLQLVAGQVLPTGADPMATVYAGHQFGVFVPQLGDGRAILLGEIQNDDGARWELQLKGAGLTPYSRQGDGRAVLRSTIREYLCSEAMAGLGIPTTRALSLVDSDTPVYREQVERGAMLLRLAPSHLRFGSFEFFYAHDRIDELRQLTDYLIDHHYPHLRDNEHAYADLLAEISVRTGRLIAHWQAVGFAHGVLNSDNMSVLGLTLDYGPFGFMEAYDPAFVCNSSDHQGRYAFEAQPNIGLWNLTRLAQSLTPFISVEQARAALEQYEPAYVEHYLTLMAAKLGLQKMDRVALQRLDDLFDLMARHRVDYTRFFRLLCDLDQQVPALAELFDHQEPWRQWLQAYREQLKHNGIDTRLRSDSMKQNNPKFILRNYLAQQAIEAAEQKDYSVLRDLREVLHTPFDEHPAHDAFAAAPPDWARHIRVSCSS